MRRRIEVVDTNALPDLIPLVSSILGQSGTTLADVRSALQARGLTEYDIYLTVKGAAIIYPHVRQVLDESCPDTQPAPIHV
jgi:hypothetical protein